MRRRASRQRTCSCPRCTGRARRMPARTTTGCTRRPAIPPGTHSRLPPRLPPHLPPAVHRALCRGHGAGFRCCGGRRGGQDGGAALAGTRRGDCTRPGTPGASHTPPRATVPRMSTCHARTRRGLGSRLHTCRCRTCRRPTPRHTHSAPSPLGSGHGRGTPRGTHCLDRSWAPATPPRTCTGPPRTARACRTRRMPPRRTRRPPSPRRTGRRHGGTPRARCTGPGTAAGLRARRRPCCPSSRAHQSRARSCTGRRHTCRGLSTTRPPSMRGSHRTRSRGRANRPRTRSTPPRTAPARSSRSGSAAPSTSLPSTRPHSRTSRCGRRRRGSRSRVGRRRRRTHRQPSPPRKGRRHAGTPRAHCSGRGRCPGCSRLRPSLARTRTRLPRTRRAVRAAPQRCSRGCCR